MTWAGADEVVVLKPGAAIGPAAALVRDAAKDDEAMVGVVNNTVPASNPRSLPCGFSLHPLCLIGGTKSPDVAELFFIRVASYDN